MTPTTTASTSAGASSSSIVELSEGLEVAATVPESDIGRIRVGQEAVVRVDAYPDQRFAARVRDIAPRAEKTDNVISFEVKLNLINPQPKLKIGMTADIDFQTGRRRQNPGAHRGDRDLKTANRVCCWWATTTNHVSSRWSWATAAATRLPFSPVSNRHPRVHRSAALGDRRD